MLDFYIVDIYYVDSILISLSFRRHQFFHSCGADTEVGLICVGFKPRSLW